MSETNTRHDTVVVRRTYEAKPERVFHAWEDPALLQRWYTPGDEKWSAKILEHDFRVNGVKRIAFGPIGEPGYTEDCYYADIVPDRRICYSMTIARADTRITASMVTVELLPRDNRTEVVVTDQVALLDGGDTAADRERGWGETLDKLTAEIGRAT